MENYRLKGYVFALDHLGAQIIFLSDIDELNFQEGKNRLPPLSSRITTLDIMALEFRFKCLKF